MNQFGFYEFVGFSATAALPDDISILSLDPDTSALIENAALFDDAVANLKRKVGNG